MNVKQFSDRTIVALNSPIDENVKTKMGKFDYLPSPIVFKQLNQLFTPSGWSSDVINTEVIEKVTYKNKNKNMIKVVAMATVRVSILGYNSHTDVATFTGTSNMGDVGGAYDTAIKGAVSVAHTRACRKLGDLFGLALYKDAQMATSLHDSFHNGNNHPDDNNENATQVEPIEKKEVKPTILDGDNLNEEQYVNRLNNVLAYLGAKDKMEILNFSRENVQIAVENVKGADNVGA